MSVLDIAIMLGLLFGLWQGYQAGLLRSLVALFGWLLALVLATYFAKPMSGFFVGMVDSPILTVVIAFLVIALCVIVLLQIILWLMRKMLAGVHLTVLDKIGGAFFGVAKNLLGVLLLLSLLAPLMRTSQIWQKSPIAQALIPYAPFAMQLSKKMASEVEQTTTDSLDNLSKHTQNLPNKYKPAL